jgi:hypothetical protein
LPGRVEVGDLRHAAQVAAAVGVTAGRAVPKVRPVHLVGGFVVALKVGRVFLPDPAGLLAGVEAKKRQNIAVDLTRQLGQQRRRQPLGREIAAVVADDPQQGAQIPFADRHRGCHAAPLPPLTSTVRPRHWPGHTQNAGWRPCRGPAHTGTGSTPTPARPFPKGATMSLHHLVKAQQDEMLRAAARERLAAEARSTRPMHQGRAGPARSRRTVRMLFRRAPA